MMRSSLAMHNLKIGSIVVSTFALVDVLERTGNCQHTDHRFDPSECPALTSEVTLRGNFKRKFGVAVPSVSTSTNSCRRLKPPLPVIANSSFSTAYMRYFPLMICDADGVGHRSPARRAGLW